MQNHRVAPFLKGKVDKPKPPSPPAESSDPQSAARGEESPSFIKMGRSAYESLIDAAARRVEAIYKHEKPADMDFDPHMDISRMSFAQVSRANQFFTALHSFMLQDLARMDAQIAALEFRRRVVKDTLTLQNASGQKKYNLDATIGMDPQYSALSERLMQLEIERKMLSASAAGVENKAACVSRDVTRRESEGRHR
jgi:hypothetical protein